MEYIPNKKLYSAVMFTLKMCPSLQLAFDQKINVAANYYHVNREDVLAIVRKELWSRAIKEAKEQNDSWYTIFNHKAVELLNVGIDKDFIFICPRCGRHFACGVNEESKLNTLYVSKCTCGFVDEYQRKIVRKDYYERVIKKEN